MRCRPLYGPPVYGNSAESPKSDGDQVIRLDPTFVLNYSSTVNSGRGLRLVPYTLRSLITRVSAAGAIRRVLTGQLPGWLGELTLLFGLLLLVEAVLPGHARLASMSPHPFWIPVILMATQYGTTGGLTAAGTAIVLAWLIGWPAQSGAEDFFDYSRRIWREPILWMGAAIVLGAFRGQHIQKLMAVTERLAEGEAQRQRIAATYIELKKHCNDLERKIAVSQDRSVEAGLAALEAVAQSDTEQFSVAVQQAVDLLLGAAGYRLFIEQGGRLSAWDASETPPSREIVAALVQKRRMLSILADEDCDILAGQALFAVPMFDAGGALIGVMSIEQLDPTRLEVGTTALVNALGAAMSQALRRQRTIIAIERERLSGTVTMLRRTGTGAV